MPIRDALQHVLVQYLPASREPLTNHPLAQFIRRDLPDQLREVIGDDDRYLVKGSAGQGNWGKGPWIAMFDRLVTTTAQSGRYPVFLFREDMQGVYLSLNQGMTEVRKAYKADAKIALRARASNYRAMLGKQTTAFPLAVIDLAPSAATNDTAFYEAGNICAKYYAFEQLPPEEVLIADIETMLSLYGALLQAESENEEDEAAESNESSEAHFEDVTKFRLHKRIERNAALSKKVKKLQGLRCAVCEISFHERYGDIGQGFIEAHHLKPLASLKGGKIPMDPLKDFAVLCSNCHRMVHRSDYVDNIEKFKREHFNA